MIADYARSVKAALEAEWAVPHPRWAPTLDVDEKFDPLTDERTLLVADDGGPAVLDGAWLVRSSPYRTVLRLTGMAGGRSGAREIVAAAADFVLTHRPGIARIESVSVPLITRDPKTGAYLASITMPVIVRQPA